MVVEEVVYDAKRRERGGEREERNSLIWKVSARKKKENPSRALLRDGG